MPADRASNQCLSGNELIRSMQYFKLMKCLVKGAALKAISASTFKWVPAQVSANFDGYLFTTQHHSKPKHSFALEANYYESRNMV